MWTHLPPTLPWTHPVLQNKVQWDLLTGGGKLQISQGWGKDASISKWVKFRLRASASSIADFHGMVTTSQQAAWLVGMNDAGIFKCSSSCLQNQQRERLWVPMWPFGGYPEGDETSNIKRSNGKKNILIQIHIWQWIYHKTLILPHCFQIPYQLSEEDQYISIKPMGVLLMTSTSAIEHEIADTCNLCFSQALAIVDYCGYRKSTRPISSWRTL